MAIKNIGELTDRKQIAEELEYNKNWVRQQAITKLYQKNIWRRPY